MSEQPYHIPALLPECIEALNINPKGIYVDVTFGGGGHSRAILEQLSPQGRLIAFDQDREAIENLPQDPRLIFVRSNFKYLQNFLRYHHINSIDGLLADLGVSFHHFDQQDRGFSFRFNAPLDMRMNQESSFTAGNIVNQYSEEALRSLFYLYGELKNAKRIAGAIVKERKEKEISTTEELLQTIKKCISPAQEKKELAQLFQALRIEVNNEMGTLKQMLGQATQLLNPEGRLVILTYHSLEDRLVKNYFKSGNFEGTIEKDFFGRSNSPLRPLNNKVIIPSQEEIEKNPRARSAKLRIAQKQ